MSDDFSFFFLGCNQQDMAQSFTSTTGYTSYGADGYTGPQNLQGSFTVDGNGFSKFTKAYIIGSTTLENEQGQIFNVADKIENK